MRTCAHVCMIRVWDISINYCVLRGIYPSTTLCFEEYIHQLLTLICLVCLEGHLNPCDSRASTCMRACVRACRRVCARHTNMGWMGLGIGAASRVRRWSCQVARMSENGMMATDAMPPRTPTHASAWGQMCLRHTSVNVARVPPYGVQPEIGELSTGRLLWPSIRGRTPRAGRSCCGAVRLTCTCAWLGESVSALACEVGSVQKQTGQAQQWCRVMGSDGVCRDGH